MTFEAVRDVFPARRGRKRRIVAGIFSVFIRLRHSRRRHGRSFPPSAARQGRKGASSRRRYGAREVRRNGCRLFHTCLFPEKARDSTGAEAPAATRSGNSGIHARAIRFPEDGRGWERRRGPSHNRAPADGGKNAGAAAESPPWGGGRHRASARRTVS